MTQFALVDVSHRHVHSADDCLLPQHLVGGVILRGGLIYIMYNYFEVGCDFVGVLVIGSHGRQIYTSKNFVFTGIRVCDNRDAMKPKETVLHIETVPAGSNTARPPDRLSTNLLSHTCALCSQSWTPSEDHLSYTKDVHSGVSIVVSAPINA